MVNIEFSTLCRNLEVRLRMFDEGFELESSVDDDEENTDNGEDYSLA